MEIFCWSGTKQKPFLEVELELSLLLSPELSELDIWVMEEGVVEGGVEVTEDLRVKP